MTPRRHSQNLLLGIHVFAFFFGLKDCGPLIEAFRVDDLLLRHAWNLLSGIQVFKYCGPLAETLRVDDLPRHYSRNSGGNPNTFKNHGPLIEAFRGRLKTAWRLPGWRIRVIKPLRNDPPPSFPKWTRVIKPFRGGEKGVIETFRGDNLPFRHSRNFLSGI